MVESLKDYNSRQSKKKGKMPQVLLNGMLTLPPSDPNLPDGGEIFDAWAFPEGSTKKIEQVGSAYEVLKKKYAKLEERMKMGASANFEPDDEEEKKGDSGEEEMDAKQKEEFEKKRKKKTKAQIEAEALAGDLYGLLGLEDKTYEAGENDINKAYKKLALQFHPDKLGDKYTDQAKEMWLKIQDAYETLSDPAKRKKYDSSLPFDETIPEEDDFTDETFYDVFGKVFNLNSKWSIKKPVPNLGDDSTPLNEVKKFYKFWENFKSWREFSQYDEYDVNEAQDRYERRYMEQENKRARREYEREEHKRLFRLFETAHDNDPRIKQELAEIEAEKLRKKQENQERKAKQK